MTLKALTKPMFATDEGMRTLFYLKASKEPTPGLQSACGLNDGERIVMDSYICDI